MDPKDGKQGNGDGMPVEWDDEELVTGSSYFSDDELHTILEPSPDRPEPPADATANDGIPRDDSGWDAVVESEPTQLQASDLEESLAFAGSDDEEPVTRRPDGADAEESGLSYEQAYEVSEPTPVPVPPTASIGAGSIRSSAPALGRVSARSIPPPPFATPSMMPPPRQYDDSAPALNSYQDFRRETTRLARTRDYRSIAALHESALAHATWATSDDMQINLLLDLAKLYRDRIIDHEHAQDAFERLIARRPGHNEAMEYLREAYETKGDMRRLHDLFASAVDTEWSPERRIELTRSAARIALDHLEDPSTAARDWERLLDLGDMDGQVTVELSQVYREAERWPDLGEFLENRAAACAGTTRVAILREAIEAFLSGARSPERAEALIGQVLEESPDDPIALASLASVRSQQGQWDALERVAERPMAQAPLAAKLDVLRLTAELLTGAGEHERAATAYLKVLETAPNDRNAVTARENHLRRKGDHEGLLQFLIVRANKAKVAEDKASLYERAARVADEFLGAPEMAADLFQQSVEAKPNNPRAYEALIALYERLNSVEGVTRALEGLASITQDSKARAAVLRRLGEHYAYRANNDDQAQRCWLEVAAILPDDLPVQKELNGIHRRRGNFAALDEALTRQLWRTTDVQSALELSREVARNLDENLQLTTKNTRAWLHVLDLAPTAQDALQALTRTFIDSDSTEVHGYLEARLSNAIREGDDAQRNDIGLQIAQLWEKRGDRLAAMAAYERVRAWAPCDDRVIEPLVRLHAIDNTRAAASVLEIAAASTQGPADSREYLERIMPLIPEDQPRQRFFLLHRLHRCHASTGLGEVVDAATTAEAWKDLAGLYERLAESTESPEMRRAFRIHLARVCEENLANPHRAFTALQSLSLLSTNEDDRLALTRLAESTGRWEDLLSVLDATLRPDLSAEERQSLLQQRAQICEQRLEDPHRAFLELQRLVQGQQGGELDDNESRALEQMQRIAIEHGLLRELEAVYGELWDRAPNHEARARVARARQVIFRDHLQDSSAAVQQALLILRLRPHDEVVAQEVLDASEALGVWDQTLPILEGVWRAQGDHADKLQLLADLYQHKCHQPVRAAELLAEALRLSPDDDSILHKLSALGQQTGLWHRIVSAIRLAAAKAHDSGRALHLAQQVAALYAEKLEDREASLDTHRWILQIWPDEIASLETVINAHREADEIEDLRVRLEQWVDRVADVSRHIERWLEIGRLCRHRLHDSAGALVAFSNVIELDPSNDEAAESMRALGNVSLPMGLRRKQVRLELRRASDQRRIELLQTLSQLEQQMGETDAAIAALRELFALDGGRDLALAPLAALLREAERWEELADLEEQAAGHAEPEKALEHLRASLRVSESHLDDPARLERLLRHLLERMPADNDTFFHLTRLLRNTGRFQDLFNEMEGRLANFGDKHELHERLALRREIIRLLHLENNDADRAEALLRAHPEKPARPDPDDAAWLSAIMLARADHTRYIEQRRRHLVKLPPRLQALVICHLAEHSDQYLKAKGRVLALYREARTIDPQNTLANDALRGLGRGVKTWRSTAALLPQPDEESLSNEQRAAQLFQIGQQHLPTDSIHAISWFERAVAVNPNHVEAWDALTTVALDRHDYEYAYTAALEATRAYERTTRPSVSQEASWHANRLAKTAHLARLAKCDEHANELSSAAYAIDPTVPSAALFVADARFEAGFTDAAGEVYATIVQRLGESLEPKQRAHALHRLAQSKLEKGELDAAYEGLREALSTVPLFPPALGTMAEVLRKQQHPVSAALHELKALLVTRDTDKRGVICRRLGELCDGELKRPDEAGAWFELAVEAGIDDKPIMRRLLEHFHRTGRAQQALITIGELIESTTDPMELAELWATRGSILADHDLDAAEEALDIALSFNPAHPTALASLCNVLEGRGDYEQLAALLDARSETGTVQERVAVLHDLAEMSFEKLDDEARGEMYLQRIIELAPSAFALQRLLEIVRRNPARQAEQLPLLAKLMATDLSPDASLCDRIIEASQLIFNAGHRQWTWALLSSLMGAAPVDPWTKGTLAELRREFERFDSLTLIHPYVASTLGALQSPEPLQAALADLCARVFLRSDDAPGALVDARTGPGKVFERVAEQLGLTARLVRSPDGTPPAGVLAGEIPTVVIRTDLLAASPGELAFIFARGLMLARPECLALASVPENDRTLLLGALQTATNESAPPVDDPTVAALASAFSGKLSQEESMTWQRHLSDPDAASRLITTVFEDMELAAMRVAAVAAGDSRTAMRAIARLNPDTRRPPGVARLEEFNSYFQSVPMMGQLFAFFASEDFARVLSASA
jgi:tetratricopeptide (TPR) repeat protein